MRRTKEERDRAKNKKLIMIDTTKLYISDHALWRYAERHLGVPKLEDVRKKLREDLEPVTSLAGLEALGFRIKGTTICTYGQIIQVHRKVN